MADTRAARRLPAGLPRCQQTRPDPRGPGIHFAGLCHYCGRATTRYDGEPPNAVPNCNGAKTTAPQEAV